MREITAGRLEPAKGKAKYANAVIKLELPWKILRHFVRLKPRERLSTSLLASQPTKVIKDICNNAPPLATALIF